MELHFKTAILSPNFFHTLNKAPNFRGKGGGKSGMRKTPEEPVEKFLIIMVKYLFDKGREKRIGKSFASL